ncbi:MAG: galactose-1-epimerase, partial [Bacteroidales bacterium]|nr:galactose-1-epimerase [Bacteroidales bacterium]
MKITQCVAASERGEIAIYTLTNAAGASVKLSALGAGILSVVVPDREGNMADVA